MNVEKPIQFDKKLELVVLPPAPALHISFTPIPQELLAGEIIPVTVNLTNAGAEALTDIYVAAEDPRWILGDISGQELPLSLLRGKYLHLSIFQEHTIQFNFQFDRFQRSHK